jgi:hypothetical protein
MTSGQDGHSNETLGVKAEEVVKKIYKDGDPQEIKSAVEILVLLNQLYPTDPEVRELVDGLAAIEPDGKHRKTWRHMAKKAMNPFLARVIAELGYQIYRSFNPNNHED